LHHSPKHFENPPSVGGFFLLPFVANSNTKIRLLSVGIG
jgi:hypothetical protein